MAKRPYSLFIEYDPGLMDKIFQESQQRDWKERISLYRRREKLKKKINSVKYVLSKRQSEILNMYFIEGDKQEEIARKLNISRNSVKTHLQRAVQKLRKILNP